MQFPVRFGGSLNVNVHYHAAVADGVFTRQPSEGRATFQRLPKPSRSDLDDIAVNVAVRVPRWLRRHGLLHEEHSDTQEPDPSALDACLQSSLGVGELVTLRGAGDTKSTDDLVPQSPKSDRRGGIGGLRLWQLERERHRKPGPGGGRLSWIRAARARCFHRT